VQVLLEVLTNIPYSEMGKDLLFCPDRDDKNEMHENKKGRIKNK
jgi:hypothetical protein